jgi:DNA-binding TFAR19-related protein (PDSD5 family)
MAYDEEENDQKRLRKRFNAAVKNMQMEQQKKEVMKQLLDASAYERLMNIKIANSEMYSQLVNLIISLAQTNRISGKLTETQFLAILQKITFKKDTTIKFEHK